MKFNLKLYKNKKTGNLYFLESLDIINATNCEDNQKMVLYTSIEDGKKFVRELNEFIEKFEVADIE